MRIFSIGLLLAALATVASPVGNLALAEREDERGDRGGGGSDGPRFEGSNRGNNQSSSGKDNKSKSEKSNQNSSSRDSQRGERNQQQSTSKNNAFKSQSLQNKPTDGAQQRSFYRGPDSNRSDGQRRNLDGENRGDRDEANKDRSRQSGQSFFDQDDRRDGQRDLGSRGRNDFDRSLNRARKDWDFDDHKDRPFQYGWWDKHDGKSHSHSPWRSERWRDRPYYWWGWTTANNLTNRLVFRWDRPAYWTYGPGRNIYYQDDYVYYDGRRVMPVDKYYTYIYEQAHNVPEIDGADVEKMDWQPLGVFAIMREDETESGRAMQLAVNRDGVISGTYFNREKNEVHPLSGMVDERSQRASWAFADGTDDKIVFETSIYNLTKATSTVMVHFGPEPEETEVWQLVRLEQPDGNAGLGGQPPRRELP